VAKLVSHGTNAPALLRQDQLSPPLAVVVRNTMNMSADLPTSIACGITAPAMTTVSPLANVVCVVAPESFDAPTLKPAVVAAPLLVVTCAGFAGVTATAFNIAALVRVAPAVLLDVTCNASIALSDAVTTTCSKVRNPAPAVVPAPAPG
jgi:hypothetical protein